MAVYVWKDWTKWMWKPSEFGPVRRVGVSYIPVKEMSALTCAREKEVQVVPDTDHAIWLRHSFVAWVSCWAVGVWGAPLRSHGGGSVARCLLKTKQNSVFLAPATYSIASVLLPV